MNLHVQCYGFDLYVLNAVTNGSEVIGISRSQPSVFLYFYLIVERADRIAREQCLFMTEEIHFVTSSIRDFQ